MNRHPGKPLTGLRGGSWALVLFACFSVAPVPAWASSVAPQAPAAVGWGESWTGGSVTPPVAMGWWEKGYQALESFLSSRAGMIQFGAIMALLALVIIWWRR